MSKVIIGQDVGSYAFNKTAKTVTLTGIPNFHKSRVLGITNLTTGDLIYMGQSSARNAVFSSETVTGCVMTLTFDTSTHNDADTLQILYQEAASSDLRCGFSEVRTGSVQSDLAIKKTGTGQTINQTGGSLVITSGTTTYQESIIRSIKPFFGALKMRYSVTLSQRIANQEFVLELVDVIGDALSMTVNSATSITVTIPNNPFTSLNVGQFMYIGNHTLASCPVGRYAIASVSGNNVNFTVSAYPASGTGTVSLWGWNYQHIVYDGTTATANKYDSQRKGWNSGDTTTAINTTASTHVGTVAIDRSKSSYFDQTSASATGVEIVQRASRTRNIPDEDTPLYLQIRAYNYASAPASTTTFTVGFVEIGTHSPTLVSLGAIDSVNRNDGLPVDIVRSVNLTVGSIPALPYGTNVIGNTGIANYQDTDVTSAAITATATTAAFSEAGSATGAVSFVIPVTAVSGTTPTLDLVVQESDDGGTNWNDIYHFERITATGLYRSPIMPIRGDRYRYVQTISGTTPSFTRSIIRHTKAGTMAGPYCRFIDRTIVHGTINSVGSTYNIDGCLSLGLTLTFGAITTTAPVFAIMVSDDGANWIEVGTLTAVASSTVRTTVQNLMHKFARLSIKTASSGATYTQAVLVGMG